MKNAYIPTSIVRCLADICPDICIFLLWFSPQYIPQLESNSIDPSLIGRFLSSHSQDLTRQKSNLSKDLKASVLDGLTTSKDDFDRPSI